MSKQLSSPNRVVTLTYLSFAVLIVVWIGAWLGKVALEQKLDYLATATGSFLYWTTAKVIIWILPALLLMKTADRRVGEVFNPGFRRVTFEKMATDKGKVPPHGEFISW